MGVEWWIGELHRVFPRSFAIVDGIVGMEGNGPIQGAPKQSGVLVMGADLVAVDSTCCRIMGIDPERLEYIRLTAARGHVQADPVHQRAQSIAAVPTTFDLIDNL